MWKLTMASGATFEIRNEEMDAIRHEIAQQNQSSVILHQLDTAQPGRRAEIALLNLVQVESTVEMEPIL